MVTDRLCQCWTRGPLACPCEAKAKQLAVVMHLEIPGSGPSYEQLHVKAKPHSLVSFLCLDPCYHTGLWSLRAWVPHGNAAVLQWKGDVILPTQPTQSQACVSWRSLPGILSLSAHDCSPWLCSCLKDGQFEWRTLLGHQYGSALLMGWDQNSKQPYSKSSLYLYRPVKLASYWCHLHLVIN